MKVGSAFLEMGEMQDLRKKKVVRFNGNNFNGTGGSLLRQDSATLAESFPRDSPPRESLQRSSSDKELKIKKQNSKKFLDPKNEDDTYISAPRIDSAYGTPVCAPSIFVHFLHITFQ